MVGGLLGWGRVGMNLFDLVFIVGLVFVFLFLVVFFLIIMVFWGVGISFNWFFGLCYLVFLGLGGKWYGLIYGLFFLFYYVKWMLGVLLWWCGCFEGYIG